uniref:BZIP domain-containing protein n=1 Tax=Kalanchoe fedtschenkoi TaxID=63787 RepID=A0A7N0U5T3_KALFE
MPELSMKVMGSEGGGGNIKQSPFQPLPRQGSVYSLTLDEVQSQLDLGKPLSSMNLDELLKSVWSIEANQPFGLDVDTNDTLATQTTLQRQASLTLTDSFSKKTVDDIWRDIQQSKGSEGRHMHERQPTLGEITLEDFLVKAGVVAESVLDEVQNGGPADSADTNMIAPQFQQQSPWMSSYPQPHFQRPQQNVMGVFIPGQPMPTPTTMVPNGVMDVSFPDNQVALSSPIMGIYSDSHTPSRKRNSSVEVVEKSAERRHKRMIKNRESAARSRSRKQAYTNELESKVSRLKEENERLRRKKKLESLLPAAPPPQPKYQLRRTSSSPV